MASINIREEPKFNYLAMDHSSSENATGVTKKAAKDGKRALLKILNQ